MTKSKCVQNTRESLSWKAVRQVRSGQSMAAVTKVLGIPKASLGNWVRLAAKGELDDAGGDRGVNVTAELMEIARLRAENARLRMERDMEEVCAISNRIAPEHLEVSSRDSHKWEPLLKYAGAIFLGAYTSESLGVYQLHQPQL